MGRNLFSYNLVQSDEARDVFAQMLEADADKVLDWRKGSERRLSMSTARLVKVWFLFKGPTNFDTSTDAIRYRADLTATVAARLSEVT